MKKIKILYIVSTLEQKGPTNQLFYIISNLDKNVFDCKILTLSQEPELSFKAKFENAEIEIKCLNTGRISGLFKNKKLINDIVKIYKPDLIHTQGIRADVYAAGLSEKSPVVTTARNFPLDDYPAKFGKAKGKLMANRHVNAFKKLNVVACSHAIQKKLGTVGINSLTIQNGVDIDGFSPLSHDDKKKVKEHLGIKSPQRIYLTVGSLISRKNVKIQIEAFNKLRDYNSILLILGDGPQRKELEQAVKGDNVLFVGQVANVKEYLQISYCFISSSLSEGLPNAVLEAMSCGLPVILSDILPHRELVEGSGYEKFLFDPSDVDLLVKNIHEIGSVYWDGMSQESRQIVEENFTHRKMSTQYQTLYKKLIENNGFRL